jgi:hypothetical protein
VRVRAGDKDGLANISFWKIAPDLTITKIPVTLDLL